MGPVGECQSFLLFTYFTSYPFICPLDPIGCRAGIGIPTLDLIGPSHPRFDGILPFVHTDDQVSQAQDSECDGWMDDGWRKALGAFTCNPAGVCYCKRVERRASNLLGSAFPSGSDAVPAS